MLNTPLIDLPCAPSALTNAPIALAEHASNFSCFNPSVLPPAAERAAGSTSPPPLLAFFRVSNIHFCAGRESWLDSVALQTHVRSYVALAALDAATLAPVAPPAVLAAVGRLFREEGDGCAARIAGGTFSGPEDPRAFWSPGPPRAPWLLVSAWADDCGSNAMHLVKLPPAPELAAAAAARRDVAGATALALVVRAWPERAALPHPGSVAVQKNWAPFVHAGRLLVEYSLEPHVVLAVDAATGACAPLAADGGWPSHPALAAVQARWGRVSGGAPPLLLARHGVYLGLAHVKRERGEFAADVGTRRMVYRHLFYAFAARPPFEVVAAGAPFALPQPAAAAASAAPTVQFAAGLALDEAAAELLVTYGVLDCGMHATRVALGRVLEELGVG